MPGEAPDLKELVAQLENAGYAVTAHRLSFTDNGGYCGTFLKPPVASNVRGNRTARVSC